MDENIINSDFVFIYRLLPDNNTEILVKVLHKNFMGGEDFLGQHCLDLRDFDVYSKPKAGYVNI